MARLRLTVETWGTVLAFDIAAQKSSIEELEAAFAECRDFVLHIDEVFSTYRASSVVSQLRSGDITLEFEHC